MPSQVYGPGDHSPIGDQLAQAYAGTAPIRRARRRRGSGSSTSRTWPAGSSPRSTGASWAGATSSAATRVRLRDALLIAAKAGGHRLPRLEVPDLPLRIGAFLFPNRGAWFGLSPNLREIVSASIGVTYWATSASAATELGFDPRSLAVGLPEVLAETVGRPA